ncbi:hypothetical protein [Nocardia sp. NPDC052112]|uniref:hypothetical protein n=1 Tax=Nocardia sp. NPDC052112 TaxID=3155646 RepID=UPI00341927CC
MLAQQQHQKVATEPNDLGRYFIERADAGDVDGLVALYEPNAGAWLFAVGAPGLRAGQESQSA